VVRNWEVARWEVGLLEAERVASAVGRSWVQGLQRVGSQRSLGAGGQALVLKLYR
jgi:hypothetical protein